MANQADINRAIEDINRVWNNPPARNGLYGNALKTVEIENLRNIKTSIEFTWPVTAIGGTNGSGKTTILQVCTVAYSKERGGRYFKLGEWIRGALKGESPPIKEPARVTFCFWDNTPSFDIDYQVHRTRWGYPRRNNPLRHVEFIGITNFAPRIERKDRTRAFKSSLRIIETEDIDVSVTTSISQILDVPYDETKIHTVGVRDGNWQETIPQVKRGEDIYTEPHMGAGEQKVVRLVQFLERLPRKSLILLEEPELTLHPDAQRGLAWYLMTLSKRQGHQIIIATHSPDIFEALPEEARTLLIRDRNGVQVFHRVTHLRVARELSKSVRTNGDIILVEDEVAQRFLTEIIQRYNRELWEQSTIVPIGNTNDVKRMVNSFQAQGIRAIGVRDPDVGDQPNEGLFSLPGNSAPETLLLCEQNIIRAENLLAGITEAWRRANIQGRELQGSKRDKKVFEALAQELAIEPERLSDRLTLAWLQEYGDRAQELTAQITEAFEAMARRAVQP